MTDARWLERVTLALDPDLALLTFEALSQLRDGRSALDPHLEIPLDHLIAMLEREVPCLAPDYHTRIAQAAARLGPTEIELEIQGKTPSIVSVARGARVVLGRVAPADVLIPGADRRHAEIDFRGPSCVVRDLGSTGGTWLDGEIIRGDRPLRAGNLVRVGPTELRVR